MENILSNLILVDASPLIPFLKLGRFDLLKALNRPLACTDFVQAEVKRSREHFEILLTEGEIKAISLVDPAHFLEIEKLYARGLGRGEASSIVLARQYCYELILDDQEARKVASAEGITLYSTAEILVWHIKEGEITRSEAEGFITTWRSLGEFPVSSKIFKDLLS